MRQTEIARLNATIERLKTENLAMQVELDALKAKLESDDYVLVPKEPTREMIDAADNCAIAGKVTANIVYKTMIAAAQEQDE